MSNKCKEFAASKLKEMYDASIDPGYEKPVFRMPIGEKTFRLADVYDELRAFPFLRTVRKSSTLIERVLEAPEPNPTFQQHVRDTLKRSSAVTVYCQLIKVRHFDGVSCWNGGIQKGKYAMPRMLIKFDERGTRLEVGMSVCVNTGYIVRIPPVTEERKIDDAGRVTKGKLPKTQPGFLLFPLVTANPEARILVSDCPIDSDSTGYFTVNFVLLSGRLTELRVMFAAVLADANKSAGTLVDAEPNACLFKPKDSKSTRLIKNPRAKIAFETMRKDADNGTVSFETFDAVKQPRAMFPKQRACFPGNVQLVCTSRKREWFDPLLITRSGWSTVVRPEVYSENPNHLKNTHCVSMLTSNKATVFSDILDLSKNPEAITELDFRLLNGAFHDLENYEKLHKAMNQMLRGLNGLRNGVKTCRVLSEKHSLPMADLMRVYDYHFAVPDNETRLKELAAMTDEQLYASRANNAGRPYTVSLYRGFCVLLALLRPEALNLEEMAAIGVSSSCNDSQRPEKRANEELDRTIPSKRSKSSE